MIELIERVKTAKKILDDSQSDLLKWCTESDNSVDSRFDIWVKYVQKVNQPWIGCNGSELLNSLIDIYVDFYEPERHTTISWEWVVDRFYDYQSIGGFKWDSVKDIFIKNRKFVRDYKIESLENEVDISDHMLKFLKSEIMVSNFGSCENDW